MPGIRRKRAGKHFTYVDERGHAIRDNRELQRIRALAIPPVYEGVWICPFPNGHLQATGRDARRRKHYRYHKRRREVRDEAKYRKAVAFARALPDLRKRFARHLAGTGLTRERVLATVAKLLDETPARVGNESYARENDSLPTRTGAVLVRRRRRNGLPISSDDA